MSRNKNRSLIYSKAYIIFSYLFSMVLGFGVYTWTKDILGTLMSGLFIDILMTIFIFIFSYWENNSSVYDAYWSVIPPFIIFLWIFDSPFSFTVTQGFLLFLFLLWGVRLTTNWWVNWKGLHHEDWRYVLFRHQYKEKYWVISFLAIHFFPTIVVFIAMLPSYWLIMEGEESINIFMIASFILGCFSVGISYFGDQDLKRHRSSIHHYRPINQGIWKYTRHPNYLGEILFWLSIFLYTFSANPAYFYSGVGVIGVFLLFELYSIGTIEKKLLSNRPEYLKIQKTIPRLFPFIYPEKYAIGKSLKKRIGDLVYVLFFLWMIVVGLFIDSPFAIENKLWNEDIYRFSKDPMGYALSFFASFIFVPYSLYLLISFILGFNRVRSWTIFYASFWISVLLLYIMYTVYSGSQKISVFGWIWNVVHLIFAIFLMWRMRERYPFGKRGLYYD